MTQQELFGGPWTQLKLDVLSKYLVAYRKIFSANPRARYFKTSYVDAFAGTGTMPRVQSGFSPIFPDLEALEEQFRKGSVRRALEVQPPFDHYVFIEKDAGKCQELEALKSEFSGIDITITNNDANVALPSWCGRMDTQKERAVVFLDPFGASVEWTVIEAVAATKAIDLWILFPYQAINRMLVNNRKPSAAWSEKLTRFFGTRDWEDAFYTSTYFRSILSPQEDVERIHKTADKAMITEFFKARLETLFPAVTQPGYLNNSKGLIFVLFFAASNEKGAIPALKIANDLIRSLSQW